MTKLPGTHEAVSSVLKGPQDNVKYWQVWEEMVSLIYCNYKLVLSELSVTEKIKK